MIKLSRNSPKLSRSLILCKLLVFVFPSNQTNFLHLISLVVMASPLKGKIIFLKNLISEKLFDSREELTSNLVWNLFILVYKLNIELYKGWKFQRNGKFLQIILSTLAWTFQLHISINNCGINFSLST